MRRISNGTVLIDGQLVKKDILFNENEIVEIADRHHRRKRRELSPGSFLPMVEWYENGKLLLTGCTGLSDFSEDCLGFYVRKGRIVISGSGLQLCGYTGGSAMIAGEIRQAELFPAGGRDGS